MDYQPTVYLLPEVEEVSAIEPDEVLPPMCPSRRSFTIAPIRNHPILKDYLHSSSTSVIPGVPRPFPTCNTEPRLWDFGDEVTEDPYWHIPRRSSTWNTRDDRTGLSETFAWVNPESPNPCNRFYEGIYGGQKQIKDAPHDLSRVNGSLVNSEPRGLLPSGFRTPTRRWSFSPPETRVGSPYVPGLDYLDLSAELDRLVESRNLEPEDAHGEDSYSHALPSGYKFRDCYRTDGDLSEQKDREGAQTGNGKVDSGYLSYDETPDNNQQEATKGIDQQTTHSRLLAIMGNSNPVQERMESGSCVERPTPPVNASSLQEISSTYPPESLPYGQIFTPQVSRGGKRPRTEVSGQDLSKRIKITLSPDK
ncbi:hypothetical protein DFH28DRAFT_883946 [Melampsora americana]|nr:hypothetical protein DFH28DRAFT_883946 [Melampsora americana]